MKIPPLKDLLKELGTVSVWYHEGIYGASCDGVLHYGESPEGAVWNVLQAKRRSAAKREVEQWERVAKEYGEIPSAGQD